MVDRPRVVIVGAGIIGASLALHLKRRGAPVTVIEAASLSGRQASITVRFEADIAAVTRDTEGHVIAGSLTDAVPTHDVWTFAREVKSDDPNWVLIETDEAA